MVKKGEKYRAYVKVGYNKKTQAYFKYRTYRQ